MREFKFRAWDSIKKEMARVSMLGEEETYLYKVTGETWEAPKHYVAIIMQYTGLKDKNGVEIYEGDILRVDFNEGFEFFEEVIFENGCFVAKYDGLLQHVVTNAEVVGNRYENPEFVGKRYHPSRDI